MARLFSGMAILLLMFFAVSNVWAQAAASLPYSHGFENDTENDNWVLENGSQANKWWIGTAAATQPVGGRSLYISTSATQHNLNANSTSYVYAYRRLNIAQAGMHRVSFDWRNSLSISSQIVRAFLVPDNITLTAGDANGMTGSLSTVPTNWIVVSSPLNTAGNWRTHTNAQVNVPSAGNYKLVFFWRNIAVVGGTGSPAAIDNIEVYYREVINTSNSTEVTYSANAIDVSTLFTIDPNAGTPTYSIEAGGTGTGSLNGKMLTVSKVGTFNIGLVTAETETHLASAKVTGVLTVLPKQITITGNFDKVYDGTTDADKSKVGFSSLVGGQSLILGTDYEATAEFDDANVNTASKVTGTVILLNTAKANNYALANANFDIAANISRAPGAGTITLADWTYGTPANHAIEGKLTDEPEIIEYLVNGKWTATKPTNAGSYQICATFPQGTNHLVHTDTDEFTIEQKKLTITGVTATNRTYNASTAIEINAEDAELDGVLNNEVTLNKASVTGSVTDADASETAKAVIVAGFLDGNELGNYTLAQPTDLKVTISKAPLANFTVAVGTAEGKEYDGTADITVGTPTISTTDETFGQTVGINANFAFNDKNAGENKSIVATITGLTNENFALAENPVVTPASTDLEITAKALTITGATATNRTYNASDVIAVNVNNAELNGVLNNEVTLDKTSVTGSVTDTDASETAKAVTVEGFALNENSLGNYTLAQPTDLEVTISPAPLANFTVAKGSAEGKEYDGTATIIDGTPTIATTDETFGQTVVINANFAFNNANAGENKSIVATVTGLTNENFALAEILNVEDAETDLAITAKQLTITNPNVTATKVYDGNNVATATKGNLAGVLGKDAVNVSIATATYNSANVAEANLITVLYSVDNGNYIKPENYTTEGAITEKALTITGVTAVGRAYNGETTVELTSGVLEGIVNGDLVTFDLGTGIIDANAGANKPVTTNITLDNLNYALSAQPAVTVDIAKLQLAVTGTQVSASKTYDGNDEATVIVGSSNKIASDDDLEITATATYNSANVAEAHTITVAYSIANDNGNYIKPENYTTEGAITEKQLTISDPEIGTDKEYDRTNSAIASVGTTVTGIVNLDAVNVSIESATYNSANVAEANLITVVYSVDNANYTKPVNYTTAGTINPLQLTITNPTVTTAKTYDGNNLATATAGELENAIDDVEVIATATYNSANVAEANLITVVYSIDNTNYTKPVNYTIAGTINPQQLEFVTITATTKDYDGSELTPTVKCGAEELVKGKDYTIEFTGTNDGTNAGSGTFTLTGIGNYTGTKEASFTINAPIAITPKPLTITANNITVTQGDNAPAYTVTYEGFVDGDSKSDLSGELKFTSSYSSNSKVGTYAIVPSGLSSEKYNISFVPGTISVLPKTIQITLKETGTAEYIDSEINEELSSNNKFFVKANTNCEIGKADLQILYNNGDISHEKVDFNGIDTVFTNAERDTIIIISPIPYENIIRQKWGMLIVNNNPQTNGGYKFTEFNWKIGGEELHSNNLQYYRASDFGEKLHPEIPVKVQLKTKEGIEISSCEGNPTEIEASPEPVSAKKQVLGLDNKKPAANAKIYNVKGKRTTGNKIPAGVYIVEEGKNSQNEVNK